MREETETGEGGEIGGYHTTVSVTHILNNQLYRNRKQHSQSSVHQKNESTAKAG